jgi:hypothetical protein
MSPSQQQPTTSLVAINMVFLGKLRYNFVRKATHGGRVHLNLQRNGACGKTTNSFRAIAKK